MRSENKSLFRATVAIFALVAVSTSCHAFETDDCLRRTAALISDTRNLEGNYADLRAFEVKGETIKATSMKAKVRNSMNDLRSSYQQVLADCKP